MERMHRCDKTGDEYSWTGAGELPQNRPMTVPSSDAAVSIEGADTKRAAVKLELYRRHTETCPDRHKGRNWLKCSGKRPCPLYCDGTIDGKRVRRSLGRDVGRA